MPIDVSKKSARRWLTAVDLYSGSGAVTAALKRRHFRVVAAVDSDKIACSTYRLNHPQTRMIERDIRAVDPQDIRDIDLRGYDLDLLVVCAPCQPFSSHNRGRGPDKRSNLILEAGRFARVLQPKLIFFENVPGLAAHSSLLEKLKRELGNSYTLGRPSRIDAADFGVPQRRVRCIMLATRGGKPPILPQPTTPHGRRVTVKQAIGHLPSLKAGERDETDALHAARNHQPIALCRLAAVPKDGGSRSALPPELALACHATMGSSKYPDVYGRMSWNEVAPTLTTGCTDITRGRFAHPRDNRAITAREAALLQTFPIDYQFLGSASEVQVQIGNAVPVKLVEALTPTFRQAIAEAGT
ncbi:MAG: DNA cytosine methyltransferase [Dokdonella sp.]